MEDIEKLKTENNELKKIIASKSDLIAVSAHQLRTSLSALKWTLKMFLNKDLGDITDEQNAYIEKAFTSNERALSLVNYLLDFNRTNDNSYIINLKKNNISNIIEKVIPVFHGELKNKNITLLFEKSKEEIPLINCDEVMMIDVIQNLIENAIKYSYENGKIELSLSEEKEDNNIMISIHDQGIGIKDEDQGNIFNKFFRATNAVEKESIGSGLGLFTTKSIIEKHKGKMWFESSKEKWHNFFHFVAYKLMTVI